MQAGEKPIERRGVFIAASVLVLAVIAAYANTFRAPFVFDDLAGIVENYTITSMTSAWSPPPGGVSVSGRPIVNVSLALSFALSGKDVWGYHAVNLLIHVLAALALFGMVRRTLGSRIRQNLAKSDQQVSDSTTFLAAAIALLWALHPLQTESVTYMIQRAESLVGLFYLLTLYAFIRAATDGDSLRWRVLSLAACGIGMATKEVMATAPLVIFLYDRTFVAGSFSAAWRQRRGLYLSYAATWLLLLWLVIGTGNRGGTAGFGLNISPWEYLCTQGQAISRYLGLSLWPHPLILDYGIYVARGAAAIAPFLLLVTGLFVAVIVALRRWPVVGFLGASFFLILGPTSSIVPVATQTIAEHRMYLPLATVVISVACLIHRYLGPIARPALSALAVVLGLLTLARNVDYSSALGLWTDVIAKRPENFRASYNRALQLMELNRNDEAVAESLQSVKRSPDNPDSHYNCGLILARVGRTADAIAAQKESLRLRPWFADAHTALGNALVQAGRMDEAIAEFKQALVYRPDSPEAHNNLGGALNKIGKGAEALPHFTAALELNPRSAIAHSNFGDALSQMGRNDEALAEIKQALAFKPDLPEASYAMGSALLRMRRAKEAQPFLEEALRLRPRFGEAQLLLAGALFEEGRVDDALGRYADALKLTPDSFEAHFNYANILFRLNRLADAAGEYREALRVWPESPVAHYNLAHALLRLDRYDEAAKEFEATLRLNPNHADARFNLGNCLLMAGRPEEAAKHFELVLRATPTSVDAHSSLGIALMMTNRPREAAPHFEAVLRAKPDDAETRQRLAEARAAAGLR